MTTSSQNANPEADSAVDEDDADTEKEELRPERFELPTYWSEKAEEVFRG